MGLSETNSGERVHIGFFGLRNVGKSSLVNAVTGQNLAVVSDVKGTTTDPVKKSMELLPIGPVVIIDTPGLDDEGALGKLRIEKTQEILAKTDIAVLTADASQGLKDQDKELLKYFEQKKLPYIIAYNKSDLLTSIPSASNKSIFVSSLNKKGIEELKEKLGELAESAKTDRQIVTDLLKPGDKVILVTPIDQSAPKGRLILPQQQTMRELLDHHFSFAVCQPEELKALISSFKTPPAMVITDSQAFEKAAQQTPDNIILTSFSILFARYKGDLQTLVKGAAALSSLKDGSKVLISEGCTHHRQCNDIGSVKMPGWIEKFTGVKPEYSFTSGGEFPKEVKNYDLIVHCGGCMLNAQEMKHRINKAVSDNVPIVNYGIAIAHMHGILKRSLEVFPEIQKLL